MPASDGAVLPSGCRLLGSLPYTSPLNSLLTGSTSQARKTVDTCYPDSPVTNEI